MHVKRNLQTVRRRSKAFGDGKSFAYPFTLTVIRFRLLSDY